MISRRNFASLAAAAPLAAAAATIAGPASAAPAGSSHSGADAALPSDWSRVRTRNVTSFKVLNKTAHGKPNDLSPGPAAGQMWVLDQGIGGWVNLTNISDGSTIKEFKTDTVGPSGVVVDDDNVMWITATHASMIVSINPSDGSTIAKYYTPGAQRIYQKKGDPAGRSSKLPPAYPEASREVGGARGNVGNRVNLPPGQLPITTEEGAGGTGAHGILSKGGLLIYAAPPSRMIYVLDKKTWQVQAMWPTPGNRPHGMTWANAAKTAFWSSDSNLNAFYLYDMATGNISERIQLPDDSPVIHGVNLVGNTMYCCDDMGWIWSFQI